MHHQKVSLGVSDLHKRSHASFVARMEHTYSTRRELDRSIDATCMSRHFGFPAEPTATRAVPASTVASYPSSHPYHLPPPPQIHPGSKWNAAGVPLYCSGTIEWGPGLVATFDCGFDSVRRSPLEVRPQAGQECACTVAACTASLVDCRSVVFDSF